LNIIDTWYTETTVVAVCLSGWFWRTKLLHVRSC